MLTDDVEGAFACQGQVAEGVLGVREGSGEADCEERGVVVDDVGVGERGKIGGCACGEWFERRVREGH